jgi:hypothetical protein
VIAATCLFGLVSLVRAASSLATERGWLPLITLAGEGDSPRAVALLRDTARRWEIILHHTELDAATRGFLDRATSSLQDFNLGRLYELLPQKEGRFRQLFVSAAFVGNEYRVAQQSDKHFEVGPEGVRLQPGDSSLVLRVAPVNTKEGDTNYLMQGRAGLALGPISWPTIITAAHQGLQLLGSGISTDPSVRPMVALRQTALSANPKLGPEDLDAVATLWEAFPRASFLLSSLGSIDDLVTSDARATHLHVVAHFDPKRAQQRFPELASYLRGLDRLFVLELRWIDAHEHTFAVLNLDSEHLTAQFELYEKDGALLPFQGDKLFVDQVIDPNHGGLRYSMRASADFRILGVRSQMRGMQLDFEYTPNERGMEMRGRMNRVPSVKVSGAALGILPTSLIDVFIPGNLEGLITRFLSTACQGNDGKGLEIRSRFDRRPSGSATVDAAFGIEALDNYLVKLGVGHFNDHVLPDRDVSADMKRLMSDAQSAFSADIERYARAHAVHDGHSRPAGSAEATVDTE